MAIEASHRQAFRVRVGRLLDGTDGSAIEDAALLVLDDRIAAIGANRAVPEPEDAAVLHLPEATALPGLMDAHVHVALPPTVDPVGSMATETDEDLVVRGAAASERMVRAGITTAYDCGERGMTSYRIRDAIARGLCLGPRLLVSGRPVTQTGGHCHFFGGEADGVDGVRAAVRRLLEDEGADGIKIMATGGGLTPGTDSRQASYSIAELASAVEEAHRLGKRVTAHAHGVPGIDSASKAGIDSIQHCTMLGADWAWSFDETVARGMVERGTRAIPTISAGTRYEVETGRSIAQLQPNPGRMTRADWWANARALQDIGVMLVPGTDVGINFTDFGEELFLELEAWVGIGLEPAHVIHCATGRAAQHLGIEGQTGTLRPGLQADVLIVDGAPDREITDLRRTRLVLKGGRRVQPTPPRPRPVRGADAIPA
ncbi:MAG: amidohydrolase family protein [Chloroflexi bacterium]|nr:amidohydrolase family protein [Chloroflexota bacterium]